MPRPIFTVDAFAEQPSPEIPPPSVRSKRRQTYALRPTAVVSQSDTTQAATRRAREALMATAMDRRRSLKRMVRPAFFLLWFGMSHGQLSLCPVS